MRNDIDLFCSYPFGKSKPYGHTWTPGESQEIQTLAQQQLQPHPPLGQHDFMVDKQPPQLAAGKMREDAQIDKNMHIHR